MTAADVLGLLAEEDRLRVVAALALGAETTAEIVAATGIDVRRAVRALTRLESGGLVDPVPPGWTLRTERFKEEARAAAPDPSGDDHGAADTAAATVLRTFLRDGRLVSIPAQWSKRRIVLDHLARLFEPGRRYPEREVDAVLRAFHPDYAALRRYLVDEGFLEREAGVYWRAGGTFEV